MKGIIRLVVFGLALSIAWGQAGKTKKTDGEVRQLLVKESIAGYSGSCPCPYSKDRAGKNCGARSAHSKPGGKSPLCYESDVTQKMVDEYRKRKS